MFKVVVVDDEPVALKHICTIIQKKCPEYEVTGTAENGADGLQLIGKLEPDVVISDVKMPVVNGIEMVMQLKLKNPHIYTIIVSGYQDFEYAKGAIQSGVFDYILKPVIPSVLARVMMELSDKLKQEYTQARNQILQRVCNGKEYDTKQILKYFPYEKYYMAIVRKNGLPRRFQMGENMEIYSDKNEIATIYGRDEMESLYILPRQMLLGAPFKDYVYNIVEKEKNEGQYITAVYEKHSLATNDLQETIRALYRRLDSISVVGLNQIVDIQNNQSSDNISFNHEEINAVLNYLEYLLTEKEYSKVKKKLQNLFKQWREEEKPQLWMEYVSKQILYLLRKYNKEITSLLASEKLLEDIFFSAATFDMLNENLLEIMFEYLKGSSAVERVDSPEFFGSIREYLEEHMSENITLTALCKKFSISQTYLSKLFRKYTDQSFNQYLMQIRIERAKALMVTGENAYVKDIAAIVGYKDQFYFSRIFSSYTGQSPSEYMDRDMKT